MRSLRQIGISLLFAAASLILVLGGISISLVESWANQPRFTIVETSSRTRDPAASTPTLATPGLLPSATILASPSSTHTLLPPTACPPPSGWVAYIVQAGDTLDSLAAYHKISKNQLQVGNCLISEGLIPNTRIYVPVQPTATIIPCGPPAGWIFYTVQVGDNLYRISLAYRISVRQLQSANCMGWSTNIAVGERLYVPNVITSTPAYKTPTPTLTPTITATSSTQPATSTATETATATATEIFTETATDTAIPPSATSTPAPIATDTPFPTPTTDTPEA